MSSWQMTHNHPRKQLEDIAPQAPLALLPGVWYSSFPIIATCLKVRAGWLEVLSRAASRSVWIASRSVRVAWRSHRGLPRGPREQNLRPKFSILGVFCPSDRNELYHTSLLSKIWGLGDRIFCCCRIPFIPISCFQDEESFIGGPAVQDDYKHFKFR